MKTIVAGGHTLSAMFRVNNIIPLRNVMAAIVARGGTLIEIPYILCSIGWDHVGALAKKMGIREIALCHFWVRKDGEALWGDPIGTSDEFAHCLATWRGIFAAVRILRKHGIIVRFIDGPKWGALGHTYKIDPRNLRNNVVVALQCWGRLCAEHDLIDAEEHLRRDPEDKVIGGTVQMIEVLRAVDHPNVKMHFDIFHSVENGEDPSTMIRMAKDHIAYLHLHGDQRRAPGAEGDKQDWRKIAAAIREIDSGIDDIPGLPVLFVARTCADNKELSKGLPPMGSFAKYYDRTFMTYKEVGLLEA